MSDKKILQEMIIDSAGTVVRNGQKRLNTLLNLENESGTSRSFENWLLVEIVHEILNKQDPKDIKLDINRSLFFEDESDREEWDEDEPNSLKRRIYSSLLSRLQALNLEKSKRRSSPDPSKPKHISPDLSLQWKNSPIIDIEIKTGKFEGRAAQDIVQVESGYNYIANHYSKEMESLPNSLRFGGGLFIWVGFEEKGRTARGIFQKMASQHPEWELDSDSIDHFRKVGLNDISDNTLSLYTYCM